jgi:cyclase
MTGCARVVIGACLFLPGLGQGAPDYVRIEKLSDRVVIGYWLGTGRTNLVAIGGQKGLAIIDTEMSPRIMAPIKERLEKAFGRNDWIYVINTHAHMHHAGGNCLFQNAVVVGHDNLPADMEWLVRSQTDETWKRQGLENNAQTIRNLRSMLPQVAGHRLNTERVHGEIKFYQLNAQDREEGYEIVKPAVTFADRHTLDLGGVTLELIYFGKGHSFSDILIHIPQEGILVSGAIVYQRAHLPGISEQAELQDVHRYLAVLNGLLAEGVKIDRVVASHGPVVTRWDLVQVRDYYQAMLDGLRAAQREGLTLEQAQDRFAVQKRFRVYYHRQSAEWSQAKQNRNIEVLWRLLQEPAKPPQTTGMSQLVR